MASDLAGCLARTAPGGTGDVRVAFQSTLFLGVRDDGSVRSVRFDPPLPLRPEVQACGQALYTKRLEARERMLRIPVSFSR